jgi:hypothetical protein
MSGRPVQPAWRYAVAGSVAAAIGLGAALWLVRPDDRLRDAAQGVGAAGSGRAPVGVSDPRATESSSAALPPSAPAMSEAPSPTQVHQMFVAAVRKAQEAPQPPAPPGIARAKTFEEAFEAMRAAEPPPVSPTAGAEVRNPFGARR